jgi:hypothetical protein
MSVGKMSVGKMSVGKMSVGKMSVGKMTFCQKTGTKKYHFFQGILTEVEGSVHSTSALR